MFALPGGCLILHSCKNYFQINFLQGSYRVPCKLHMSRYSCFFHVENCLTDQILLHQCSHCSWCSSWRVWGLSMDFCQIFWWQPVFPAALEQEQPKLVPHPKLTLFLVPQLKGLRAGHWFLSGFPAALEQEQPKLIPSLTPGTELQLLMLIPPHPEPSAHPRYKHLI